MILLRAPNAEGCLLSSPSYGFISPSPRFISRGQGIWRSSGGKTGRARALGAAGKPRQASQVCKRAGISWHRRVFFLRRVKCFQYVCCSLLLHVGVDKPRTRPANSTVRVRMMHFSRWGDVKFGRWPLLAEEGPEIHHTGKPAVCSPF